MDYIYGEIDQKAITKEYRGGRTNTADVTVENGVITVEAHANTDYVEGLITERINQLNKTDSEEAGKFVTAISESAGIIDVTRKALVETDIPSIHQSRVIGLEDKLDNIENEIAAETTRAKERENEIETEIIPEAIDTHNISLTSHLDIRNALEEHKSDTVKHITNEERTYWNDKVNDVQVDDISVVDENGIAKIPAIALTEELTATQTIGGISKGTTFPIGTPVQSIVKQLLQGDYDVDVYFGLCVNLPTTNEDVEALSLFTKSKQVLLKQGSDGGFAQEDVEPNGKYVVLAIPRESNLNCFKIRANSYPVERIKEPVGNYYIYHLENPTEEGIYRFDYSFEVK